MTAKPPPVWYCNTCGIYYEGIPDDHIFNDGGYLECERLENK